MKYHKHIPFKFGTITWTADHKPSDELIKAFENMAQLVLLKTKYESNISPERMKILSNGLDFPENEIELDYWDELHKNSNFQLNETSINPDEIINNGQIHTDL